MHNFNLEKLAEFDNHKWVSILNDVQSGLKGYICIHRGGFGLPAFGATRMWAYKDDGDALKDVLKLSRLMTYKSALAGLKYGGAKAVLFDTQIPKKRNTILKKYAQYVNCLNGHFITGADVGISEKDLKTMDGVSKHMVGVKSDPVKFTVIGLIYGIEYCLKEIYGDESFSQRSFAIQGLGKTGMGLLRSIYNKAKKIYVSDIDELKLNEAKALFPNIEIVRFSDIYKQRVDVYSPCALSNAINIKNISKLHCRIIAGSANSQLENSQIGDLLFKLGILYAPDYVINAGGLIAVVDEYENNNYIQKRIDEKVVKIKGTLKKIIVKSKIEHKATNRVADELAEFIFNTQFI